MTDLVYLTLIVVASVPTVCPLLFFGHTRWRDRATDFYARRAGLTWDAVAESLALRTIRREIAWLIGSSIAYVLAVVGILTWGADSDTDANRWLPASLLVLLAGLLGQVAVGVRNELRRSEAPRLARIKTPVLADYVSPRILRWSRVCTPLGVAMVTAILLVTVLDPWEIRGRGSLAFAMTVTALVLTVLAWVLQPILSRAVLTSAQPANNHAELVWADANRAEVLSDLRLNPMGMAGASLCAAATMASDIVPFGETAADVCSAMVCLGLMVLGLVIIGVSATMSLSGDSRFYLVRLWPEIARASSLPLGDGPGQPTRTMSQPDASESRPC